MSMTYSCSRLETKRDLYIWGELMKLLVYNMLCPTIAAVAMAILIMTYLVPSMDSVASKYLKLITTSVHGDLFTVVVPLGLIFNLSVLASV
ncbi:hypothetical protein DPMN_127329 [Dreissena polymorpha]|uniref:Uncharacterized protein n=1 Tax=Dreissena polymorpha TaxID=45954 RepID=A0A9D4JWE7_DREPO|nr:hypothetical protein DPMN_127329 [Dreissena polymorpha]